MSSFVRVLLISGAVVLVYDIVAASASRAFGFAYASASLGSYLIYATAGFMGARAGGGVAMGVLAAVAAGLVDATAGWLVSAWIGPGRPTGAAATSTAIGAVVVIVPVLAGIVGLVGAVVAWLVGLPPARGG